MPIVTYISYTALKDGTVVGRRGLPIVPVMKRNGYLHFSQSLGYGKPNQTLVHRFIWEYFNGNIPEGLTVDHIDGDKTNNALSNLQLLTRGENSRKSASKLSFELAKEIKSKLGKQSNRSLAREYGVSEQAVCDIKKGRRWAE